MANDQLPVTIALVQMACSASKEENVELGLQRIRQAAEQGANIVCLQELFHSQYPCQSENHDRFYDAEPIPGPITSHLAAAARQHGVAVIGSVFERRSRSFRDLFEAPRHAEPSNSADRKSVTWCRLLCAVSEAQRALR